MKRIQNPPKTYAEKMKRANHEAILCVIGFLALVAVWILSGFGLAGTDIMIAGAPLWVYTGLAIPCIAAIIASVIYTTCVSVDFPFDDEEDVGDD